MNWFKSIIKQPPQDGTIFLGLVNDTPALVEFDTYNNCYIAQTLESDTEIEMSKKNHRITYWCKIELP